MHSKGIDATISEQNSCSIIKFGEKDMFFSGSTLNFT